MMKPKSVEWLSGFLFCEIERIMFKVLKEGKDENYTDYTRIPLLWFGLKYTRTKELQKQLVLYLIDHVEETLSDAFVNHTIHIHPTIERQYIRFDIHVGNRKKQLTVSQIENILGYPIEIIAES